MRKLIIAVFIVLGLFLIPACSSSVKLKNGDMAFRYKNYEKAVQLLPNDYEKAKSQSKKVEIARQLVESYKYLQNMEQVLKWSKMVADLEPITGVADYVDALKSLEKYSDAYKYLDAYLQKNKDQTSKYKQELSILEKAQLQQKDTSCKIIPLSNLNSVASDYGLFFNASNAYFTSNRNGKAKDGFSGNSFSQIFIANQISDSTFDAIQPFTINDFPYHFAQITFNADKTEAYFTQCGSSEKYKNDYCNLFVAHFFNNGWTEPKLISFFNDSVDVAQPFLSSDGNELYFTSNYKEGYGGSDIYVSKRNINGNFSQAYNLGNKINTADNEAFPTIIDSVLYFSSDRKNGYGGLDIYKAKKNNETFFNQIELLPLGINSGADDFYLFYTDSTQKYISSNRVGGIGKDDLYLILQQKIPEKILPKPVYLLVVSVKENVFEHNNPNSKVIGTKNIDSATVFIPFPIAKEMLYTNYEGKATYFIHFPLDFELNVYKTGYLNKEIHVALKNLPAKDGDTIIVNKEILLQKIYKNVEIVLNNIYYDYDKANIRQDAKVSLGTLVDILKINPSINIELASHTDCRGSEIYNLKLSQQRAESVVNYLIEKGISKDRLVAKGYGETQLLNKCECTKCTEEQHQQNRRTTFKILE